MAATATPEPWYRRVMRWGQTNIREVDALPRHYDVGWWVEHWRRTRVQGVIVNAGGIVAYYPTALELHRRAPTLGDRDLFGELTGAARAEGLAVVARMDSSRANERCYYEHPDWFAVDGAGQPFRAGVFGGEPFYTACVSGPYYREFLPRVLRELCERYRPDGFSDNSWSGLVRPGPAGSGRGGICHCPHCRESFRTASDGLDLPRAADWESAAYRRWIDWSYAQRTALWELNNAVTHRYGGPDCEWSGMQSGSLTTQCRAFRDWREMTSRVRVVFLDHQGRSPTAPLWGNGEQGKLVRSLMGDGASMPESIAFYNNTGNFRLSSKPEPEVRLWFAEAVAGGIRPWWHHVGADHEDRRMFRTAEPLFRWHERNERYLQHRRHLASVAIVYSQRNHDVFGRDDPEGRCDAPARGLAGALVRARIPYALLNADDLGTVDSARYRALLLPNVGALSDEHVAALRDYVAAGGGLLASGETSLYDGDGARRADFALADLFGAHATGQTLHPSGSLSAAGATSGATRGEPAYLRFADPPGERPEPLRAGSTAAFSGGWEETAHLPFGGDLVLTRPAGAGERVALTFIPPFPTHPPEFASMSIERTGLPCLYLRDSRDGAGDGDGAGRVAFLPADVDRTYARLHQPDHGELLAALTRWVARHDLPVRVTGPGLVDVHAYTQDGAASGEAEGEQTRIIVHLVNLTHAGTWQAPVDELTPVGTQRITLRLSAGRRTVAARLLVAGTEAIVEPERGPDGDLATVTVPSILDHEVVVVELT